MSRGPPGTITLPGQRFLPLWWRNIAPVTPQIQCVLLAFMALFNLVVFNFQVKIWVVKKVKSIAYAYDANGNFAPTQVEALPVNIFVY